VLRTGGATLFLDGDGRIVLGTPVRLHPPPITRKAAVRPPLSLFPAAFPRQWPAPCVATAFWARLSITRVATDGGPGTARQWYVNTEQCMDTALLDAYYSTWHQYFPFDNVRISIAR
jgi:hypothetical protein